MTQNSLKCVTENRPTDMDAEYLEAEKAGDMETAQRMVDLAAMDAGYTIAAYHSSLNSGFV